MARGWQELSRDSAWRECREVSAGYQNGDLEKRMSRRWQESQCQETSAVCATTASDPAAVCVYACPDRLRHTCEEEVLPSHEVSSTNLTLSLRSGTFSQLTWNRVTSRGGTPPDKTERRFWHFKLPSTWEDRAWEVTGSLQWELLRFSQLDPGPD